MAMSGLSRVRTELVHFFVTPSSPPHPVQLHRKFPGHRNLRDLSPAPHGQMEKLAAPLRMAAYRDLGCFHQQEPQQGVALFADVPESSPIPAGFLRWNQPYIAGDLLGARETLRGPNDEFES